MPVILVPESRLRAALLAALAGLSSACATAPISPADRQAANDAQVDLAVCVTEADKPNFFFNPLPKMLADQVESRYRPPRKPSFNRLTRLPYGGDASSCEVVIALRADGQAIWNLRHAILTNAATKEELLHTSSQQACGPCFAGMMDGLILPIIKALDSKGPLHAAIKGGGPPPAVAARRARAAPLVAAASAAAGSSMFMARKRPEAPAPAAAAEAPASMFMAKKRPEAPGSAAIASAEPEAPAAEAPAAPEEPSAAEAAPPPEPAAPAAPKFRGVASMSASEIADMDSQIFP